MPEQSSARVRAQLFIDLMNELKAIIDASIYDPSELHGFADARTDSDGPIRTLSLHHGAD